MTEEKQLTISQQIETMSLAEQVEVLASMAMPLNRIAAFVRMPARELREKVSFHEDDPLTIAYLRGKAKLEIELAATIRGQAFNGDSIAIGRLQEMIKNQLIDEEQ